MAGNAGRPPPPKMSMQVLLESLGLGDYFKYFQYAGMSMVDGHSNWTDKDVDDILNQVEERSRYYFDKKEKVLLWKALRLMWSRGPGHDVPFIQQQEIPPMFLPKRDWRQMDADQKYAKMEPDRQRQVLRKLMIMKGGKGLNEMQFEVYRRQQDIFYELKDVQNSVALWMKSDSRKMLREDPREEAMKLRIRTMLDAAAGFLQVRKLQKNAKNRGVLFFLFCRVVLLGMAILMYFVGWNRYSTSPTSSLQLEFWVGSGQFLSGNAFFLAFWVAFVVSCRNREDLIKRRFQRIVTILERLLEEISAFRIETDHLRMEEHEAVRQILSAQISEQQNKYELQEAGGATPGVKKRRRKKKVDKDLEKWAPGVNASAEKHEEFKLKAAKAMEESYKRLPPLPGNFRRGGGDRMLQFEDRGFFGGVAEHEMHYKAPVQQYRGEPQPAFIPLEAPQTRALPGRPPMPPPGNGAGGDVPSLEDLRNNALGETPPMGPSPPTPPMGGLGATPMGGLGATPSTPLHGSRTPGPPQTPLHGPQQDPDDSGLDLPDERQSLRDAASMMMSGRTGTHSPSATRRSTHSASATKSPSASRHGTHSPPATRRSTHSPRGHDAESSALREAGAPDLREAAAAAATVDPSVATPLPPPSDEPPQP